MPYVVVTANQTTGKRVVTIEAQPVSNPIDHHVVEQYKSPFNNPSDGARFTTPSGISHVWGCECSVCVKLFSARDRGLNEH